MERLENMGLLATRVAHDLNNMLAPMRLALPMLRSSLSDTTARNLLDSLESTVGRATALVRQILEYADGVGGQLQLVPMQGLLEEIGLFASETFPRNIKIHKYIPPDLWQVHANLSQIHQVLLNLCVNARDAMPDGGVVRIRLEVEEEAAVISVRDSGAGMSEAVQRQLFTPFFTTKGQGGSGLGLHVVQSVVEEQRGQISVESSPDRGSTFRLRLPFAAPAN